MYHSVDFDDFPTACFGKSDALEVFDCGVNCRPESGI